MTRGPGDEQFAGSTKRHMAARLFLADTTDGGKAAPAPHTAVLAS